MRGMGGGGGIWDNGVTVNPWLTNNNTGFVQKQTPQSRMRLPNQQTRPGFRHSSTNRMPITSASSSQNQHQQHQHSSTILHQQNPFQQGEVQPLLQAQSFGSGNMRIQTNSQINTFSQGQRTPGNQMLMMQQQSQLQQQQPFGKMLNQQSQQYQQQQQQQTNFQQQNFVPQLHQNQNLVQQPQNQNFVQQTQSQNFIQATQSQNFMQSPQNQNFVHESNQNNKFIQQPQTQNFAQQPQQDQNFVQQQPIQNQNFTLPQNQIRNITQQPTQMQNFIQQQQNPNFLQQQNFVQQQQKAFNEQWLQWSQNQANQIPPANIISPSQPFQSGNDTSKIPLPPDCAPPLPPPSGIVKDIIVAFKPPLPPSPDSQFGNIDNNENLGKILSTNLPGLMDILSGKSKKDEGKIPGFDFDSTASPKVSSPYDVELVDLIDEEKPIKVTAGQHGATTVAVETRQYEQTRNKVASNESSRATAIVVGNIKDFQTIIPQSSKPPESDGELDIKETTKVSFPPSTVELQFEQGIRSAEGGATENIVAPSITAVATTPSIEETETNSRLAELSDSEGQLQGCNKSTLKAFDNKFREWEKQFDDWKKSSAEHPDQTAYATYLSQWEDWREKLLLQRRFIIESISKDRVLIQPSMPGVRNQTPQAQPPISMPMSNNGPRASMDNSYIRKEVPYSQPQPQLLPTPATTSLDIPKPAAPSVPTKDDYETRDLSKLIQNPFAVTGGPISSEQRHFLQNQSLGKAQQLQQGPRMGRGSGPVPRHSMSGPGIPFQRPHQPSGKNPFEVDIRPKSNTQSLPNSGRSSAPGKEPSPERVSRQHRNVRGDFSETDNPFDLNRSGSQNSPFNKPKPFTNAAERNQSVNPFDIGRSLPKDMQQQGDVEFGRNQGSLQAAPDFRQNRSQYSNPQDDKLGSFPSQGQIEKTPSQRGFGILRNEGFDDFQRRPAHSNVEDDLQFARRSKGTEDENEVTEAGVTPLTFDYGHGSNRAAEDSLFTRDRNKPLDYDDRFRSQNDDTLVDDENEDPGVVTFDYGHMNTAPVPVVPKTGDGGENEELDSYHDRYNYDEAPYPGMPPHDFEHHPHHEFSYPPGMRMRGRGFRGPGMFRGRGMFPPMFGGFPPRPPFPFRHPHPGYYEEFYEPEYPYPPPGRGRPFLPPQGRYPPPEGFRPSRPLFPIGDFERPLRIAPPPPSDDEKTHSRSPELRQAPPRNKGSPDPSSKTSSRDSKERDMGRGKSERDLERSTSRGRERNQSGEKLRRLSSRNSRERDGSPRRKGRDLSPYSRRRRESPVRRDRRGRSRSRSRTRSPYRARRISPDRRTQGGRRSSPPSSSSSSSRPVLIEDILNLPGRNKRPAQIVIVLRGLPGSGKTHVARLIKDRETELGDSAPRILSLDDYFMTGEVEKTVKDSVTGKETKEKIATYEYDAALETRYRDDLFKTFRKTIEAGYFHFIIVDGINDKFRHFQEMTNFAKSKKFQVYVVELEEKAEECAKKNIHNRTIEEIRELEKNWERTPSQFTKLDVRTLLQDDAVQLVEMEDVSDLEDMPAEDEITIEIEDGDEPWASSRWETSEDTLNKLDGLSRKRTANAGSSDEESEAPKSMEQWLQTHLPEDYSFRIETQPGKKRVRWADIEARRDQERAREIGFVVGQTDWNQITDPSFASSALTRTKYF